MPIRWLFALLCLTAATLARAQEASPDRLARLSRGVNVSHWLWLPHGKTDEERRSYFTRPDAEGLVRLGITHIRLPFEPERLYDPAAQTLREEGCRDLDDAIALCVQAGLAVVVDCHPRTPDWVRPDASGRFANLEGFWAAIAPRLAATDPDRIFLEILNEPHELKDPATWPAAQSRLAAIIRDNAPRHT